MWYPVVPTTVVDGGVTRLPPIHYDVVTGEFSGGSLGHNRPLGDPPW